MSALYGLPATPTSWSTISTALDRKREAAALAAFGERFFTVLRGGPATTRCCRWWLRTIRAFDLEVGNFNRLPGGLGGDRHHTGPILESSDPPAAREHARQLGLAFLLINFIRDVAVVKAPPEAGKEVRFFR